MTGRPLSMSPWVLALALLCGCTVGPDYQRPEVQVPERFTREEKAVTAGDAALHVSDASIVRFWTLFGDPVLDDLVERALQANHDIRIAAANLDAARAIRGGAVADLFPLVGAGASRQRSRLSADETLSGEAESGTLARGSVDMYWEIDLFGRVRRNVEASRASEQAIGEELHAAKVSVIAEVAGNYVVLRGVQEQYAVAKRNADNQRQTLNIVETRREAGRGTEFDTVRARAQLNTTLAQLPTLAAEIDVRVHRLSVLIGQPPAQLDEILSPVEALPPLPRLERIGEPGQLLRRRPDIRAAERRLAAATAGIGVAQADWFPRVSFTGELGFAADSGDRIGNGDTATYRYGPGISWSILDFGHIRARVAQSRAAAQGALARYERTVLQALEETENALTLYGSTRQQLDYLQVSATANERAVELAHLRFDGGSADFLEVLDVERARLAADASLSQARTAAATSLIDVYKALGGGWENDAEIAATGPQSGSP